MEPGTRVSLTKLSIKSTILASSWARWLNESMLFLCTGFSPSQPPGLTVLHLAQQSSTRQKRGATHYTSHIFSLLFWEVVEVNVLWKFLMGLGPWFSSVQSLSRVWLVATPQSAAHQASLSITNSRSNHCLWKRGVEQSIPQPSYQGPEDIFSFKKRNKQKITLQ